MRIDPRQAFQGFVNLLELDVHRLGDIGVQQHLLVIALASSLGAHVVDQRPAHHARGERHEMRPILPVDAVQRYQAQQTLVQQIADRERDMPLAVQQRRSRLTQFVIEQMEQHIAGMDVAGAPAHKQVPHIARRHNLRHADDTTKAVTT